MLIYIKSKISLAILAVVLLTSVLSGCTSMTQRQQSKPKLTQALQQADQAYQDLNWSLAIRRYQHVVELWPEDSFGYFRLGNAYLQKDHINKAIHTFEIALQKSPNDARIYNNLSIAHLIKAQDLLVLLDEKLRPSDVSARRSVTKRLELMEQILATPILGVSMP